jgi:hypothetical protein
MRLFVRALMSLAVFSSTFNCSETTAPKDSRGIAAALAGTWADTLTFPGNSLVMHLVPADSLISGTGTFSEEALASGTLTVSGIVASGQVDLDLTYSNGQKWHFRGNLTAIHLLDGIWFSEPVGDPVGKTFRRVAQ